MLIFQVSRLQNLLPIDGNKIIKKSKEKFLGQFIKKKKTHNDGVLHAFVPGVSLFL